VNGPANDKGHRAGFVNMVGNPNVGKSTLMNRLVGERLSMVTSKAQTTRHRILGIVHGDNYQIVYSDTPGIIKPAYKLQESMLEFAESALQDADILLLVTDPVEKGEKSADFLEKVARRTVPGVIVINKIALTTQDALEKLVAAWEVLFPRAEIIPVSATMNFNIDYLQKRILALLPESPPYFEKEALTDRPTRFFISEIIREKILLYYQEEIPYATEVVVESFEESADLVKISAVIVVERDSQKGIIIGKQGKALKKTATRARQEMEKFLEKKVFLQLFVKVEKDWRNKESYLTSFGYRPE
jgi:GTP-binding protein Era